MELPITSTLLIICNRLQNVKCVTITIEFVCRKLRWRCNSVLHISMGAETVKRKIENCTMIITHSLNSSMFSSVDSYKCGSYINLACLRFDRVYSVIWLTLSMAMTRIWSLKSSEGIVNCSIDATTAFMGRRNSSQRRLLHKIRYLPNMFSA